MVSPQFCSLSVTYLRNQIVNALRIASDPHVRDSVSLFSPNIVFENPTLKLLATRIASLVDERGISQSMDLRQQHVAAMSAMIEKYSVGLSGSAELPVVNGVASHPNGAVVLLTGSTGGLGSFLLSQLLETPTVERVYALNRPSSSTSIEERQSSAFVDKGLSVDLLNSGKLVHVEADASRDNCGFSPGLYEEVWNASLLLCSPCSTIHLDPRLGNNHYSQCLAPQFQPVPYVVRAQHQGHSKPCQSRTGRQASKFAPLFVYIFRRHGTIVGSNKWGLSRGT
jgi:hypothetical protein